MLWTYVKFDGIVVSLGLGSVLGKIIGDCQKYHESCNLSSAALVIQY